MPEAVWSLTVPNCLTFARIALAVPVVLTYRHGWHLTACALFTLACVSDWIDGHYARRYKCETEWGRQADPVADKLTVLAVFIVCLDGYGAEPVFIASMAVIFAYDAGVIWMRKRLTAMKTSRAAKWKTFVLMLGCTIAFYTMTIDIPRMKTVALATLAVAAMLAIVSIVVYFRDNYRKLFYSSAVPAE